MIINVYIYIHVRIIVRIDIIAYIYMYIHAQCIAMMYVYIYYTYIDLDTRVYATFVCDFLRQACLCLYATYCQPAINRTFVGGVSPTSHTWPLARTPFTK